MTNRTKSSASIILLIMAISSLSVIGLAPNCLAQSGTNVNGIITADATWTQAGSPYSLTGPVAVNQGVTLTIGAGTTVNLNSYYMQVNGTLTAIGTSANPITISGGSSIDINNPFNPNGPAGITFYASSTNWNEQTGSGSIMSNVDFSSTQVAVDASTKITNTVGAGLLLEGGSPLILDNSQASILEWGGSATISGNILTYGIDIEGGSPTITDNTITGGGNWAIALGTKYSLDATDISIVSGNTITGDYYNCIIASGDATIQNNLLLIAYSSTGIEVAGPQSYVVIQDNTVVGSDTGLLVTKTTTGNLTVVGNNFEEISKYLVDCETPSNTDAVDNYWGTTNQSTISQAIYDNKNNFNLGTVNFVPYLDAPNPQAPSPPAPTPSPTTAPSSTSASTTGISPTPTSTPAVPELSLLAIASLFLSGLFVALVVRHRKNR